MKKSIIYGLFVSLGIFIGLGLSFLIRPPFKHYPRWQEKLNITQEQKDKIKGLFKEDRQTVRSLIEEMEQKSSNLKAALKNPQSTEEDLQSAFKDFNQTRNKLTVRRFKLNLKIREIVGAEKMDNFDLLGPMERPHRRGFPKKEKLK